MFTAQKSLLQKLDECPPFLVFALARKGAHTRQRPSPDELIAQSGLSEGTFYRLCTKTSWAKVRLAQLEAFSKACGVDLLRLLPQRDYWKKTVTYKRPFAHLNQRQLKKFRLQCARWMLSKNGS